MEIFNRKALIIGIDGATWKTFNELIEKDYMPYLKSLIENSKIGSIKSTIPPISPAAWATIQTGKDAINMNIYEFYCFDKITKNIKIVNSNFLDNTIWKILSKVGKRIAVINVPMTYPPKPINGYIISGILTPSLDADFTYPAYLKFEILKKIPDYQLHYSEDVRYGNPHYDIDGFIKERIKNIKDRTKVCVWLLNNFKLDILMVNFQANDILQHVFWGYMNKGHELYDENIKTFIFKNFYKTLDFCIEVIREEFIRNSKSNLLTMIISDHGCETHNKRFFLGDWLVRNRFLILKTNILKQIIRSKIKNYFLKLESSLFNIKLLNFLKNFEFKFKSKEKGEGNRKFIQEIVDWKKSLAFSLGISLYGLIFILKEGESKLKIKNYIKKKLLQLRDPENNKLLVKRIYEKEELYRGHEPDLIPDLIIQPNSGYSFTGLFQNVKELFQKIDKRFDFAIGKHDEEGILIINGEGINPSKINDASLKDIVPTLLKYFGLPIPKEIDGKPLKIYD